MSDRNRNIYQSGGHSGRESRLGTGRRSFDKGNNLKIVRKEYFNKKEEENRKEMYFFFKEPVEKKKLKIKLGGNDTEKVCVPRYETTTKTNTYSIWLRILNC